MMSKVSSLSLENFGVIPSFDCDSFSRINLIIGENGTGKTFLLKALYSIVRAMEDYHRGDDVNEFNDLLAEKLRWTFQIEKLGDLVTRSSDSDILSLNMKLGDDQVGYQFSQSAMKKITTFDSPKCNRGTNSIFIPAKEVLSLYSVILKSREVDRSFGFDDTYYDLAKALRIAPTLGKNYKSFSDSRKDLKDIIDGKVELDDDSGKWYYKNSYNQKFSIGATAEGIKRLAIMDRLLANGYLDDQSIIFIDEIESALHPSAILRFLDMIAMLAEKTKLQFFISSHSYFVIKKLAILAMDHPDFITCISLNKNGQPDICDLSGGMPENSIIDTSIKIYDEEIEKGF